MEAKEGYALSVDVFDSFVDVFDWNDRQDRSKQFPINPISHNLQRHIRNYSLAHQRIIKLDILQNSRSNILLIRIRLTTHNDGPL